MSNYLCKSSSDPLERPLHRFQALHEVVLGVLALELTEKQHTVTPNNHRHQTPEETTAHLIWRLMTSDGFCRCWATVIKLHMVAASLLFFCDASTNNLSASSKLFMCMCAMAWPFNSRVDAPNLSCSSWKR